MRPLIVMIGLAFAATSLTGCLSVKETQQDQDKIRAALDNLYENQLMDNLIRAANGLPFVQIDYTNATTTVGITESGNLGGTQDLAINNSRTMAGAVFTLSRMFTNHWAYGASAMNSNQIALTANPVINNNDVYDAYLQFLANQDSLIVSCDPPPPGKAHVCRKWKGKYYWVPVEYRFLFLRLALITTFQRGQKLQPLDPFFTVNVKDIAVLAEGDEGITFVTATLDAPVPDDSGRIEFTIDTKRVVYTVEQRPRPKGQPMTGANNTIVIRFNPKTGDGAITDLGDFKARLPLSGKLFLDNSRPQGPTTGDLLEAVRFQLEQIRLGQLRPPPQ